MDCYQKVNAQYKADLSLIYIPHLDYPLQRLGTTDPAIESHIKQVDQLLSPLMDEYENSDCHIIILSEYSISNITKPPIQLNRLFRKAGWLVTRNERGGELIDTAQSKVFAVCDHQVAHIYVRDQSMIPVVKSKIQALPLVDAVLDEAGKKAMGLNHDRSGELVAVANRASWFSYYYWLTDDHAPDFAKTVDIHRKPGYDPVELFLDPTLKFPALHIAWRLLKKKLGQRTLMDLIPLDDRLVKGSHGQLSDGVGNPLFISSDNHLLTKNKIQATEVKQLILNHIFQD